MSRRHMCKQLFNLICRQGRESPTLTCTKHCRQAFDIHTVCRCLPACFSTTSNLSRDHQHSQNSPIRNESANTFTYRSHLCGTLNLTQEGQKVTLCGWVDRITGYFFKLYDWSGLVQILLTDDWLDKLSDLERESVICVTGEVRARPAGQENKAMATGDIEIIPEDVRVLNTCRPNRPLEPRSHQQITEKVRSRYRYLDIRNKQMQHNLRLRSAVIMKMRDFLCNVHGFVDVETPTLFRKTPGGAKEFIVPSRYPGKFYSLPQSPQQFKQLLMVGGIDRYFQVARCYRDELSKPDRQPEFTQLDIEMSFASQSHIRDLIERLLHYCWPASQLGNIESNFPEMTYAEAMRDYGTDKPDIRFDMKLVDITDTCKNCGNQFLEEADTVQAIRIPDGTKHLSNKDIDSLLVSPLEEEAVKMISVKFKDSGQWRSSAGNTMTDDSKREISSRLGVNIQDLVVLAVGKGESANKVLGRLRLETASLLEEKGIKLREEGVYKFLWVVDFPLFLPKEDEDGVESAHHPFTAPHEEDAGLVYSDFNILKVRSQHYDLVLNGSEVGGGSVRIHDAQLQRHVLQHVLKEDISELKHLLDALELGCPPHAGIALGLDRLVAIMCGAKSIRDVIAFPKFGVDKDLMSEAPVTLSDDELATYHLQVIKS